MNSRPYRFGVCLVAVLLMFVIGCASPAPAPTPVPPTALPTVVPPTEVPTVAPTSASGQTGGTTAAPVASGPLQDAITKTKNAAAYRVNLNVSGQGNFASTAGPTPDPTAPADKPIVLLAMQGEVNGKDAHYSIQGKLTEQLGISSDKTFEVVSSAGDAYVKGPVPILGANEDKWYKLPANAAQIAEPPLTPASFLDSFGQAGINPTDFKSAGTETLDTQSCDVYAGDKTAVVNAFSRLGGSSGATQEDLDSIDNAEFKFWICGDGYLHQVRMLIQGHDKTNKDQKGSFEILVKLTDFGTAIQITPPPDSSPLQLPQSGTPETSPQASPTP